MKYLRKVVSMVLIMAMVFVMTGCGAMMENLTATTTDHLQKLVDAYKNGDMETFKAGFEDDDKIHYMLDAVGDTDSTGMKGVYQKVYELTKAAEITIVGVSEEQQSISDEYITIKIKTVDFSEALQEAMTAAMEEGGEAFADMPGWMMEALNTGGVSVEKEFDVRIDTNGGLYTKTHNEELYETLFGGFYDYIAYTMTTCTAEEGCSYLMASKDEIIISYDEFSESVAGYGLTDADIDAYIAEFMFEYKDLDGVAAGGYCEDEVVTLYQIVNYEAASAFTLQRLGIVSGGSYDYISLNSTIKGFEADGMTCETTDFGSGVLTKTEN
ncbi:MAG: hypothetical protein E7292_04010 [Lachnospiraceae bacterium]|nr:hypothetical protein [Lachnospiraceae bacterium]